MKTKALFRRTVILLITLMSAMAASAYDFMYDGFYYNILTDNTVAITYKDVDYNTYSGTVNVPATVTYNSAAYNVTGIGDYAFAECRNMTKVTLPATIESIGKYAFYNCSGITNINIPNGVTSIGNGAFQDCSNLKSLMFPAGVTVINSSMCAGCTALKTVWLPVHLTNINAVTFSNCDAIENIFCLSEVAPSINRSVFASAAYDNATLYIPEDANGYTSTSGSWQYFTKQEPYNQFLSDAINADGTNITFSTPSTDNYPWLVKTSSSRICAQSGNAGIHNSTSDLTATVTVNNGGTLSFDYKAWGEGISTAWDVCIFYVDGEEKLKLGAYDNSDWESFSVELDKGNHTLQWRYSKDHSENAAGDYFAISNVSLLTNDCEAYACYTSSNTTLTFYYDELRSTRTGTTYDLNESSDVPGWDSDGTKDNVTKVVFDSSFADARPKATNGWFDEMVKLRSITGMSYLNTSEVNKMSHMFNECNSLTSLDLSTFNTSKVTDMYCMFYGCSSLTSLDLSHFDTSQVDDMRYMFGGCTSLTSLDLGSFNTSKVNFMNWMFSSCENLQTIYVGSGWSTATVNESDYMFLGCTSLVGGQGTAYYDYQVDDMAFAQIDGGITDPGYFTDTNSTRAYACYTSDNTTLTFYYDTQCHSRPGRIFDLNTGYNNPGWKSDGIGFNATKVVFDSSFASARPTTTNSWFEYMNNLISIEGISYLNTSEVTDMDWMFYGCHRLTSLDLSHFNTSKVTSMVRTFSDCTSLTSLDLSSFNTSEVTEMNFMFSKSTNLQTIYVGYGWNTAAVTDSYKMFDQSTSLVGGQGTTWKSSNPIDMTYAHIDGAPDDPGYFTARIIGITTGLDNGQRDAVNNGQRDSVKGQRDEWFTLDGQKLSGKPTKRGVYIVNGQKVVVR